LAIFFLFLIPRLICFLQNMQLEPPSDKSIVTLWLGNVEPDMTEADIRAVIYPYGQIASFNIVRTARCAFVEYVDREAAEGAAAQLYNALMVNGRSLTVNWARPRAQNDPTASAAGAKASHVMPPPPGMERAPASAYVLPGMPAPVTSWPPPPDVSSEQARSAEPSKKRPLPEDTTAAPVANSRPKFAPAPPRAPPPSSVGLLAGLSAYGDDEDEDESPAAVPAARAPAAAKPAKGPGAVQYPSMNPTRLGASV
jgi:pre-mRNA-splicing factor RBM22/SLT11